MNRLISFDPLFRQSVGFDRFSDLFEDLVRGDVSGSNYPPYNVEKFGEDSYRITMAVAGFSPSDIDVTQEKDTLTVSGKGHDESEEGVQYLYRGIAKRAFQRTFRLADYVNVKNAELKDGILRISLERELPEEAKPRKIAIESASDESAKLEGKSAH